MGGRERNKEIKGMILTNEKGDSRLDLRRFVFSRVLRDSTPHCVGRSFGRLVPFLGSGPKGADDLCFHTWGNFSLLLLPLLLSMIHLKRPVESLFQTVSSPADMTCECFFGYLRTYLLYELNEYMPFPNNK